MIVVRSVDPNVRLVRWVIAVNMSISIGVRVPVVVPVQVRPGPVSLPVSV